MESRFKRVGAAFALALIVAKSRIVFAQPPQERVAEAVAAHDYAALKVAAGDLTGEPGFATAAAAASDFATLALRGEGAEHWCRTVAPTGEPVLYLTELSRLLERSLRFDDAATCLVRAAAFAPSVERREVAAKALVRAGREVEASALLATDGDTALLASVDALAGVAWATSSRWTGLRWYASGEEAEGFGELVEAAYAAFVAEMGHPLQRGLSVERLAPALRSQTRLAGLPVDGAVGITLGGLVSIASGLPPEVEREVVWHEIAHAFLAEQAPYGGPSWLGEAVAFAWSRSLLERAGVTLPPTTVTQFVWNGWIEAFEESDAAALSGEQREARDAAAARLGGWFARRFGTEALLAVYLGASRGEPVSDSFARVSGTPSAELRNLFEASR